MSRLAQIDLHLETFQKSLFGLASAEQVALLATFGTIVRMTWDRVYRDKGLHWEAIHPVHILIYGLDQAVFRL